jgi:CubicO group peptidase (beta-lactamase class C family)
MADPESIILHRAEGYWVNRNGELINRNATETSSTLGAGGLLSSVHDMVKWDNALNGNELLTEESRSLMWSPVVLENGKEVEYGFGWNLSSYKGKKSLSHGGQVAGFVAYFARFPDEEISVIVFLNRYRVSSRLVKDAVMSTFYPELGPLPER